MDNDTLCLKEEIEDWLRSHSIEGLIELLNAIVNGED